MSIEEGKPRFLLVGHQGSNNRGCEALVRTTVDILRHEFAECQITLASMHPENDLALTDIENLEIIPGVCSTPYFYEAIKPVAVSSLMSLTQSSSLLRKIVMNILPYGLVNKIRGLRKSQLSTGQRAIPRPLTENGFRMVRHLKQSMMVADVVISIGGDLYIEDYGPPLYALELLEYAQFLGRKSMVWGASIWPLHTEWVQERVAEMLRKCDLVTVRDEQSEIYLNSLGISSNVKRVADGAFIMPAQLSSRVRVPWVTRPNLVIGLNASNLLSHYLSSDQLPQALAALLGFIRMLIDRDKAFLILVPHDGKPGAPERDFLFEFAQVLDRSDSVYMAPLGLNAPETKALIGLCDYFIAMRFHPSIAALSQAIPTLGFSHSPKFAGLHNLVYGHTDFVIPYSDMISLEKIWLKYEEIKMRGEDIKNHLNLQIPHLQNMARLNGSYLREMLAH